MPSPDKAKVIPSDVQLMVADDGVFLGFFPENGPPALINVEDLVCNEPLGILSRSALATWAAEQRHRAATSANVSER